LTVTNVVAIVTAVGVFLTGLGTILNARRIRGVKDDVGAVRHEVKTSNGKTMAHLADLQEGRRIIAEVPVEEQTHSDRQYIEQIRSDGE
jgi:hypothetical protein